MSAFKSKHPPYPHSEGVQRRIDMQAYFDKLKVRYRDISRDVFASLITLVGSYGTKKVDLSAQKVARLARGSECGVFQMFREPGYLL
jgi:hypothetical protein